LENKEWVCEWIGIDEKGILRSFIGIKQLGLYSVYFLVTNFKNDQPSKREE
jgi:hypothetical protein